jgi:hypothetical protein
VRISGGAQSLRFGLAKTPTCSIDARAYVRWAHRVPALCDKLFDIDDKLNIERSSRSYFVVARRQAYDLRFAGSTSTTARS